MTPEKSESMALNPDTTDLLNALRGQKQKSEGELFADIYTRLTKLDKRITRIEREMQEQVLKAL